jgi:hypothetical protein
VAEPVTQEEYEEAVAIAEEVVRWVEDALKGEDEKDVAGSTFKAEKSNVRGSQSVDLRR